MKQKPARSLLLEGAGKLGLSLLPEQVEQFMVYLEVLQRWNRRMNLTALTEAAAIIEKHFLDSLMGAALIHSRGGAQIIDIGTGAGFPSIPLKIQQPEISITLVESSRKKTAFLLNLCGVLGLQGVRVLPERVESLQEIPDHQYGYDYAVARAFAKPMVTFRAAIPFLARNGRMLLYLASSGVAELGSPKGWETRRLDYRLPFSDTERSLILLSRSS